MRLCLHLSLCTTLLSPFAAEIALTSTLPRPPTGGSLCYSIDMSTDSICMYQHILPRRILRPLFYRAKVAPLGVRFSVFRVDPRLPRYLKMSAATFVSCGTAVVAHIQTSPVVFARTGLLSFVCASIPTAGVYANKTETFLRRATLFFSCFSYPLFSVVSSFLRHHATPCRAIPCHARRRATGRLSSAGRW